MPLKGGCSCYVALRPTEDAPVPLDLGHRLRCLKLSRRRRRNRRVCRGGPVPASTSRGLALVILVVPPLLGMVGGSIIFGRFYFFGGMVGWTPQKNTVIVDSWRW